MEKSLSTSTKKSRSFINEVKTKIKSKLFLGWTDYREVQENDRKILKLALEGFSGIDYAPEFVSVKRTAGLNYRFRCAGSISEMDDSWEVLIEVYKPTGNGNPIVTGITRD